MLSLCVSLEDNFLRMLGSDRVSKESLESTRVQTLSTARGLKLTFIVEYYTRIIKHARCVLSNTHFCYCTCLNEGSFFGYFQTRGRV